MNTHKHKTKKVAFGIGLTRFSFPFQLLFFCLGVWIFPWWENSKKKKRKQGNKQTNLNSISNEQKKRFLFLWVHKILSFFFVQQAKVWQNWKKWKHWYKDTKKKKTSLKKCLFWQYYQYLQKLTTRLSLAIVPQYQ